MLQSHNYNAKINAFKRLFSLLLQSLLSHPGAQLLHSPCVLSHVSLFKQFPLHTYLQLIPKVPLLHAILIIKNNYVLLLNIDFGIVLKIEYN